MIYACLSGAVLSGFLDAGKIIIFRYLLIHLHKRFFFRHWSPGLLLIPGSWPQTECCARSHIYQMKSEIGYSKRGDPT